MTTADHFLRWIAALAPGVVLAVALLRFGSGFLKPPIFFRAVLFGAIWAFIPLCLAFFEHFAQAQMPPLTRAFVTSFIFAGLFEEATKMAAALMVSNAWNKSRHPGITVATAAGAGLGFALFENLWKVGAQVAWAQVAIDRALVAVPMHTLLGLFVGYGIARARLRTDQPFIRGLATTLLIAALLHGLYDLPLFLSATGPLFPAPLVLFTAAFSLPPTAFLSVLFACNLAVICILAMRATAWALQFRHLEPRYDTGRIANFVAGSSIGFVLLAAGSLAAGCLLILVCQLLAAHAALETVAGLFGIATVSATAATLAILSFSALRPRATLISALFGVTIIACFALTPFFGLHSAALSTLFVNSGRTMLSRVDLASAHAQFSAALDARPDDIGTLMLRSHVADLQRHYDASLADLTRAIALKPDDAQLYVLRSAGHVNRHDLDAAAADVDRAISLDPKNAEFRIAKSEVDFSKGDKVSAAADIETAASLTPDLHLLRNARADLAFQRGDSAAALKELDEAIKEARGLETSWVMRGRYHFDRGEFTQAANDLAVANVLRPDAYTLLWLFAARERSGGNGRAELDIWSRRIDRSVWPGPLIDLYLGLRTFPSLTKLTLTSDERCEAQFYEAQWLLIQGQTQSARPLINAAAADCPLRFVERDGARAEQTRLEQLVNARRAATSLALSTMQSIAPLPKSNAAQNPLLGREFCQPSVSAKWSYSPADPSTGRAGSLEISALIPRFSLNATVQFTPRQSTADSDFEFQFQAPRPKQLGTTVRALRDVMVRSPSGLTSIGLGERITLAPGNIFLSDMKRSAVANALRGLFFAQALTVALDSNPDGNCSISFTVDGPAIAAIRSALDGWKLDAAPEISAAAK